MRDWPEWRDARGSFYALGGTEVLYDSSSWKDGYRLFVPYAALDLPSGRHPVVVRFAVRCANVGAALEFDHVLVKP